MKITDKQKDALQSVYNEGYLDETDTLVHKNTIHSLHSKGLIANFNYSNCKMWELTDKGKQQL
jgi:predicted transcriptional regulator